MKSICGIDCTKCGLSGACNGCAATDGQPVGAECLVAQCCKKGETVLNELKEKLIAAFNALNILDMEEVTELHALKEQPEAQEIPADWAGSIPNLEGDILVSPGSGDDSEFNRISVSYDENTLFAIQTIYDGGARSELSAATAADLASGQFVHVWGSPSGSGMKATRICITKVM